MRAYVPRIHALLYDPWCLLFLRCFLPHTPFPHDCWTSRPSVVYMKHLGCPPHLQKLYLVTILTVRYTDEFNLCTDGVVWALYANRAITCVRSRPIYLLCVDCACREASSRRRSKKVVSHERRRGEDEMYPAPCMPAAPITSARPSTTSQSGESMPVRIGKSRTALSKLIASVDWKKSAILPCILYGCGWKNRIAVTVSATLGRW